MILYIVYMIYTIHIYLVYTTNIYIYMFIYLHIHMYTHIHLTYIYTSYIHILYIDILREYFDHEYEIRRTETSNPRFEHGLSEDSATLVGKGSTVRKSKKIGQNF